MKKISPHLVQVTCPHDLYQVLCEDVAVLDFPIPA